MSITGKTLIDMGYQSGSWFPAAIKAALHPAHGPWTYFVTVNPKTGLTKFTSSFAEFQKFRAELAANIAKGK